MLIDFVHVNNNIFMWSPSNMPGIPREVAEHSLDIRAGSKLIRQRLCRFDEEKRRAIGRRFTSYWRPDSSRRCSILSG
jgi:hypothetical protein